MSDIQTIYEKYKGTTVIDDLCKLYHFGIMGGENGEVKAADAHECMKSFIFYVANKTCVEVKVLNIDPEDIETLKIKEN